MFEQMMESDENGNHKLFVEIQKAQLKFVIIYKTQKVRVGKKL